ncbi:hypothetical protein KFL_007660030 [Klebsormidium nitens]|uniref:Ubiquitin-like domain-containing protein n=1 Tax=Klebsormidium nitens TaxID=105231 RepID=A0A1Y1IPA3_KLENI|nr:hypothetical protein KFL_007660030 [Klebsormidium nitens]|eukprot:GAQ91329.1 hypothetical protein KFL_007660030 [Klebsormidium nitens]
MKQKKEKNDESGDGKGSVRVQGKRAKGRDRQEGQRVVQGAGKERRFQPRAFRSRKEGRLEDLGWPARKECPRAPPPAPHEPPCAGNGGPLTWAVPEKRKRPADPPAPRPEPPREPPGFWGEGEGSGGRVVKEGREGPWRHEERVRGKRKAVAKLQGKRGPGVGLWIAAGEEEMGPSAEELAARKRSKRKRNIKKDLERKTAVRAAKELRRRNKRDDAALAMCAVVLPTANPFRDPPLPRRTRCCPFCTYAALHTERTWAGWSPEFISHVCDKCVEQRARQERWWLAELADFPDIEAREPGATGMMWEHEAMLHRRLHLRRRLRRKLRAKASERSRAGRDPTHPARMKKCPLCPRRGKCQEADAPEAPPVETPPAAEASGSEALRAERGRLVLLQIMGVPRCTERKLPLELEARMGLVVLVLAAILLCCWLLLLLFLSAIVINKPRHESVLQASAEAPSQRLMKAVIALNKAVRALMFATVLCVFFFFICSLEQVAPLESIRFHACYFALTLSCSVLTAVRALFRRPNRRPLHWSAALVDAGLSFGRMITVVWHWAVAMVAVTGLLYIDCRQVQADWGTRLGKPRLQLAMQSNLSVEQEAHSHAGDEMLASSEELTKVKGLSVVPVTMEGDLKDAQNFKKAQGESPAGSVDSMHRAPTCRGPRMQLLVRTPEGGTLATFTAPSATVAHLMTQLEGLLPIAVIRLSFGGRPLDPTMPLRSYGIRPLHTLEAQYRLRGGGGHGDETGGAGGSAESRTAKGDACEKSYIYITRRGSSDASDPIPLPCERVAVMQYLDEELGWGKGRLLRRTGDEEVATLPGDKLEAGEYVFVAQQGGPDVSVVEWLVSEYGDLLKKAHSREPLGALRDGGFDPEAAIQDHIRLQGRKEAFECCITLMANIFSIWKRRNPNLDQRDYRRHVVHLLLLSCPGSGKTTFLTYILRWLREWLKKPSAYLKGWLGGTMFGEGNLSGEKLKLVHEMLGALRIAAGSTGFHTFGMLRVEEEGVSTTEAEAADGFTAKNAPALRLLYALLCPLDSTPSEKPPGGYYSFLRRFSEGPSTVKDRILIQDVVAFAREGLEIPEGELLLMPLLIDEGNIAKGVFLNENPPQTGDNPTWLKWFLSKITLANNDDTSNLNLIIPITATTRWDSTSLQWTASGQAQATYIPLKPLSLTERKEVICDLATRVAAHNGRPALDHEDLPLALRNDGLDIVGGNPRLVSWLLEGIGGRSWATGLDEAVKAITPSNLVNIVKKVKQAAYEQLKLKRIIDLTASPEVKKSCLQVVVATMMLDLLVKRKERLKDPFSGLDLPITWGELEGDGVVELIPLLRVGVLQPSQTASGGPSSTNPNSVQRLPEDLPSATRATPAPLLIPLSQPSSHQPVTPSAALPAQSATALPIPPSPTSLSPLEGADAAEPVATPLPGPSVRSGSASGASSPPFNRMGKGGRGEVVVRDEDWGVLVETGSGDNTSPTKLGMLNRETACPQPTSEPGDEWVKVSMGFFMFTLLLERMELVRESDLSAFSDAMVRESPLDKEKADVMAVALKLQALHLIGRTEFSLSEAFPNLRIPADLAGKRFLVPPGPLSVGDGLPMGHQLTKQAFATTVAAIAGKIQERIRAGKWGKEALSIGLVGPGNDGWDGFVVLLEAKRDPKRDPWVLFCQSKQESSPTEGYVTLKEILRNLESDIRQTPYSPPTLPTQWVQWLRKETDEAQEAHAPAAGSGDEKATGAKLEEAGKAVGIGKTRAGKRPRPEEVQERALGAISKKRALAGTGETVPGGGEQAGTGRTRSKVSAAGAKEEPKGRKRKEPEKAGEEELLVVRKVPTGKESELRPADRFPDQDFGSDWTCNMIYSFVCDRRFSRRQLNLLKEVERRGHPWLQRLLIVSREDQDSWYSRIGALRRSATLHWLSEKMVLKDR